MKFTDVISAVIRREHFGGIVYLPTYNAQVAINDDMCNFIESIKHTNSLEDALRKVSDCFKVSKETAHNTLNSCLSMLGNEIHSYRENQDQATNWRLSESDSLRLSAPLMLIIEITKTCNQACSFCYQATEQSDVPELSFELIRSLVDQASVMGVFKIQYMGGGAISKTRFYGYS